MTTLREVRRRATNTLTPREQRRREAEPTTSQKLRDSQLMALQARAELEHLTPVEAMEHAYRLGLAHGMYGE